MFYPFFLILQDTTLSSVTLCSFLVENVVLEVWYYVEDNINSKSVRLGFSFEEVQFGSDPNRFGWYSVGFFWDRFGPNQTVAHS